MQPVQSTTPALMESPTFKKTSLAATVSECEVGISRWTRTRLEAATEHTVGADGSSACWMYRPKLSVFDLKGPEGPIMTTGSQGSYNSIDLKRQLCTGLRETEPNRVDVTIVASYNGVRHDNVVCVAQSLRKNNRNKFASIAKPLSQSKQLQQTKDYPHGHCRAVVRKTT